MDEKDKIRSLYRRYWQYMIDKDTDSLRELMSDNYILMHMTGVRQSKETFLSGLTNGTFNYYSAEHDSIEVTVSGDTAHMIGKSRVTAPFTAAEKASGNCAAILHLEKKTECGA